MSVELLLALQEAHAFDPFHVVLQSQGRDEPIEIIQAESNDPQRICAHFRTVNDNGRWVSCPTRIVL